MKRNSNFEPGKVKVEDRYDAAENLTDSTLRIDQDTDEGTVCISITGLAVEHAYLDAEEWAKTVQACPPRVSPAQGPGAEPKARTLAWEAETLLAEFDTYRNLADFPVETLLRKLVAAVKELAGVDK